jgi:hypothetical protein
MVMQRLSEMVFTVANGESAAIDAGIDPDRVARLHPSIPAKCG